MSPWLKRCSKAFARQPGYYDLAALDAVEALMAHLAQVAVGLSPAAAAQWQRDTVLLQFTAPLRAKIRQRLQQTSDPFNAPVIEMGLDCVTLVGELSMRTLSFWPVNESLIDNDGFAGLAVVSARVSGVSIMVCAIS